MSEIKWIIKLIIISFLPLSVLFAQDNNIVELQKTLQKSANDSLKIVALTDIVQYYLYEDADSSIKYCDEIIELATETNSWMDVGNAYNLKAISLQIIGEYSQAVQCSKTAIDILKKEQQKGSNENLVDKNFIRFHNTVAVTYYCISDFPSAAENYHTALDYAYKMNDEYRTAVLLSNLGSLYQDWGNFELSRKYQREAYQLAYNLNDSSGMVRSIFNIGSVFFTEGKNDSAYFYYQKALPLSKSINDYSILIPMYINLASIQSQNGDISLAERSLGKAKDLIDANNFKRSEAFYHLTSGNLFIAKHNFNQAIQQLTKAYLVAEESGDLKTEQEILVRLHETYSKTGNYKEAYHFSEMEKAISDSIFSEESARRISELEVKFEVEKTNMKMHEMQIIQESDKKTKLYLSVIMISLVVVFVMVIYVFVQKRKRNKLERELLLNEKEKLDKDLNFTNRQLTSQALMMMQKNNLLSEISESMSNLGRKLPVESRQELSNFRRQLKRSIRSDEDWDLFKHYFEEVNRSFYPNLLKINNRLTPSELKLSALIKLRFSIKETASLLNISPDSVKTARHVLRKKLGLQKSDNITDFLNDLN